MFAGRTGRRTSSPPQFGQTPCSRFSRSRRRTCTHRCRSAPPGWPAAGPCRSIRSSDEAPASTPRPPRRWRDRQVKTLVAVRGDLVAFLPVCADAADIRHEHTRLARNVGAHVPGCGGGIERRVGDVVDMLHPGILRPTASARCSRRCRWRRWLRQSLIQSTCCSIETIMLLSTDGLPGPVIMNMFGKPAVIRPR